MEEKKPIGEKTWGGMTGVENIYWGKDLGSKRQRDKYRGRKERWGKNLREKTGGRRPGCGGFGSTNHGNHGLISIL